jgi:hypothetical protein
MAPQRTAQLLRILAELPGPVPDIHGVPLGEDLEMTPIEHLLDEFDE